MNKGDIISAIVFCHLLALLVVFILYAPAKASINFCQWSVSAGVSQRLGRELTPTESSDVREVCKGWYTAYKAGDPYLQQEMSLSPLD